MTRFFITSLLLVTPIFANEYTGTFTSRSTGSAAERAKFASILASMNANGKNTTIPNPAIVGGEAADDGEFPWFGRTSVSFFNGDTLVGSFTCGASLIYKDIAVSAAHCVVDDLRDNPTYTFLMDFNLGANEFDGSDGTVYEVVEIVWPTDYEFPTNDIVYYKLNIATTVTPVVWNTDPSIPNSGDIGTAVGFGRTSAEGEQSPILLKVDLPAISNEECIAFYGENPDSITCADGSDEGKSTCQGDSGGPILTGDRVLYGMSSFAPNSGCTDGPVGFTRTSYFREFTPKVICDYSASPPDPCVGFEDDGGLDEPCGLFGLSLFCPFTFGGIIGQILRAIFGF